MEMGDTLMANLYNTYEYESVTNTIIRSTRIFKLYCGGGVFTLFLFI